jgi:3'(2'), 5'-bisphosphate nucleotidase
MPEAAQADFGAAADPRVSQLLALAHEAGDAILRYYGNVAAARLHDKDDGSPLTAADLAAHETIMAGLQRIAPGIPIISEENSHNPQLPAGATFWLVDPLDGTREFINRNGEFTVNIALVRDGLPVLAVVHAPALGVAYAAQRGLGAWRIPEGAAPQPIRIAAAPQGELNVVASRSHSGEQTAALLRTLLPLHKVVSAGSSLKFCLVAEGRADFYPRLGTTMEWDTAAGHCVLEAAGGRVVQCDGAPLRYNKRGWRNPHFFAVGAWLPVYDRLISEQRPTG